MASEDLWGAVEARAAEWESWAKRRSTTRIDAFRDAAEELRDILATHPPTPETCHCGRPVKHGFDGDPTHHRGMCADCDEVRCDAYPQDCPWRHFPPTPAEGAGEVGLAEVIHDVLIERTADHTWVEEIGTHLATALAPLIARRASGGAVTPAGWLPIPAAFMPAEEEPEGSR